MQGTYKAVYKDSNTLQHHGVKGQKWGVRRYQNYDGSLTKEGYIRNQQRNYEDEIIPKGTMAYRVANSGEKLSNRRSYVSLSKDDFQEYKDMPESLGIDTNKQISNYTYKTKGNLKKAGVETAVNAIVETYGELKVKDLAKVFPEDKKTDIESILKTYDMKDMKIKDVGDAYKSWYKDEDALNTIGDSIEYTGRVPDNVALASTVISTVANIDFMKGNDGALNRLRDKGYDAVIDLEDARLNNISLQSATVILNPKKSLKTKKVT